MQKVGDLGTPSQKRKIFIKFFSTGLKDLCGRGGEMSVRTGTGDRKESRPSAHSTMDEHMNSVIEAACIGPR